MSFPYTGANHGIVSLLLLLLLLLLSPAIPPAGAQVQSNPGVPAGNLQLNRFTPSMIIIVVILVAALFIMTFFSIYIRNRSNAGGESAVGAPGAGRARSRRVARGLDPAVIETFPTLAYSEVKGLKIGKGALECAVCLCEFEDDEKLRLIPKCDHVFHPECIDEWLTSHTTCPVCRANLVPQTGESTLQPAEYSPESDVESQNDDVIAAPDDPNGDGELPLMAEPVVLSVSQTLNRNRTRGSRSSRPRKFPRSHSTGHSLVQPGENTDRFTLRLPVEVRKQIMNKELNRATSMVVLTREGSSRRGNRTGGEGSSRWKHHGRPDNLDRAVKSDRWVFSMTPPFFLRALSLRSPKVTVNDDKEISRSSGPGSSASDLARPPV